MVFFFSHVGWFWFPHAYIPTPRHDFTRASRFSHVLQFVFFVYTFHEFHGAHRLHAIFIWHISIAHILNLSFRWVMFSLTRFAGAAGLDYTVNSFGPVSVFGCGAMPPSATVVAIAMDKGDQPNDTSCGKKNGTDTPSVSADWICERCSRTLHYLCNSI